MLPACTRAGGAKRATFADLVDSFAAPIAPFGCGLRLAHIAVTMDATLEELVAVDEELRARVAAAERAAQARIETALKARAERDEAKRRAAAGSLEDELRAIAADTEAQIAARRRNHAESLARREGEARTLIPAAARAWAAIVRGGSVR